VTDTILALVLSGGLELSAATPGLLCRCFERDTNVTFCVCVCVCVCVRVCMCVYVQVISKLCLCAGFGDCLMEWDYRSVVY
jgi:hypothetical protein